MEKFEKLDNEQKELVKYWIDKFWYESTVIGTKILEGKDSFIEKYLTPEFVIEVGKWYKSPENKFMIFVEEYNPVAKMIIGYGFNSSGYWFNKTKTSYYKLEKATPEEVEQRLIEEAKRRGVVKGVKIINIGINSEMDDKEVCNLPISGVFKFFTNVNILDTLEGNGHVFDNGKWAEIIDEKKSIPDDVLGHISRIEKEFEQLKSKL